MTSPFEALELNARVLPPPDAREVKARSHRGEEVSQFRAEEGGDEVRLFTSSGSRVCLFLAMSRQSLRLI